MQQLINALLKIILQDANQQKPIQFSVKRWNEMFVEFHSWYLFEFKEWMIDITNMETWEKARIRDWVTAKLGPDVLNMLKDWANKDFSSWIIVEDEDEDIENTEAWAEDDWASEEPSEPQQEEEKEEVKKEEKKEVKRQIPSSWAKKK